MRLLLVNRKFQILAIIVLTVLAYSNIFQNGFVWDDEFFIPQWEAIRNMSSFPQMLQGALPSKFSGAFRPGLSIYYLLFYQLFGQNTFGWHLQSLLVHLLSTVLVYLILEQLIQQVHDRTRFIVHSKKNYHEPSTMNYQLLPFLTALLFGLHPIHTEAVTYVAASINTIGVLFFFSSFYFYLKAQQTSNIYYLISITFAFLAFFTYEFTLTLPLVIILYIFLFRRRVEWFYKEFLFVVPYFIFVSLYVLLRIFFIHSVGRGGYLLGSFYLTFLVMIKAFVKYLYLLLLPINQSINHIIPNNILSGYYIDLKKQAILSQTIFEPMVLLGILGMLGLLGVLMFYFKKAPLISFGIGWFLITMLPASNIVPVQEIMAERYLYLPSIGFCLIVAYVLYLLLSSQERIMNYELRIKKKQTFIILASCFLLLFYGYLTFQRNKVWASPLTLWEDTVKKSPISEIAYFNLGNAYGRTHEYEKAIDAYKNAIKNKPKSMGSFLNLGNIYIYQEKYNLAQNAYEGALRIDPGSASHYNNIGGAFEKEGNILKAIEYYLYALRLDSNHKNSKENLERILKAYPNLSSQSFLRATQTYSDTNISFSYPKNWVSEKHEKTIILRNELNIFLIQLDLDKTEQNFQEYVNQQPELHEVTLINQGFADIPSFDKFYVRIYKEGSVESMQFFLFKKGKVPRIFVTPSNSAFMGEFDKIVGSIDLK